MKNLPRGEQEPVGFTLIEMMIVVVIVAVLVAVAGFAYTRHVKNAKILQAKVFVATIQARQESYFQQFGIYVNAGGGAYYPTTAPVTPVAWAPTGLWLDLGAVPDNRTTLFQYNVVAGTTAITSGSLQVALGIPVTTQLHPWYYVIGRGNLNGVGVCADPTGADLRAGGTCTMIYASSGRTDIITMNDGR